MNPSAYLYPKIVAVTAFVGLVFFSFNTYIPRDNLILLYDSKRFFICFLLIINSIFICSSNILRKQHVESWVELNSRTKILILVFFAFVVLSTINAELTRPAVYDLAFLIGALLLVTTITLVSKEYAREILITLTLISVLLFLSVISFVWLQLYHGYDITIHSTFGFTNIRFLNRIQVWLIIPIVYLYVTSISPQARFLLVFCLSINISLLIATDARGASVALFGAIILLIITESSIRRDLILLSVKSIVIGFLLKVVLIDPTPSFLLTTHSIDFSLGEIRTTSSGRWEIWKSIFSNISFLGLGGEGYVCHSTSINGPHNSLLLILANWGVIPSIIFILLGLTLFQNVLQKKRQIQRFLGINLLAGLAYSLVSSVLDTSLSQLMAIICLAMYWGVTKEKKSIVENERLDYTRGTKLLFIISFISLLVIIDILITRTNSYQVITETMMKPKFWFGMNCPENLTVPYIHSYR